jgi:hypothetical protein
MRRYFFHITDGAEPPDHEGTVLADIAAARAEAITTAGALLKDRDATFWGAGEWRMTVVDEAGDTICRLRFSAE